MTTIGIIGSGSIGGTVAALAVGAGYHVVLSNSRGPATLSELVGRLGPLARAATPDEAAETGELVLVSVPLKSYPALSEMPVAGKVVLDTGNYYPDRDGTISELENGNLTDSGYLSLHLGGAQVVKVFNNIFFKHLLHLARPTGSADRSFLPIAGDSGKDAATEFLDAIGYGAVDAGPLAEGWRQQPGTPAYGSPYGAFDNEQGTPAGADVIQSALAAATPPGGATFMTTLEDAAALVREERGLVVVSTLRADGSIQSSLVNAGVLTHPATGETVLGLVTAGPVKLANLRARPQVTATFRKGWQWATVEGAAQVAGPDDPQPWLDPEGLGLLLRTIFGAAGGEHDDWDTFDRVMAEERRAAVLVSPRRIYSNSH